jgi:hypothetical protein
MEIRFHGQYDRATFFKAVRLANQPAGSQRKFLWFLLAFGLGALVLLLIRAMMTADWAGNAILLGAAALMVLLVGGLFLRPYFAAWQMWANPGTRRLLKGQVNNHSIIYLLDIGTNEIPWNRIRRIRINEHLAALVRDDGLLLVFPRRFFKRNSDWRNFTKLASSKIQGMNP